MHDLNFPVITYDPNKSPFEWGAEHGEQYREAIQELVEIRKGLMLNKNPALERHLPSLSKAQWEITKKFSLDLTKELEGISHGAQISQEDVVILNNYTDFRDIQLAQEGCSTIHCQFDDYALSGQTWDMHRSAKNYLCLIHVPKHKDYDDSLILSLVGCSGLMGMSCKGRLIGVNNINTENAKAGLIWPVLVRETLRGKSLSHMREVLLKAPVTSGHNYIISTQEGGEHWEVTPEVASCAGEAKENKASSFHTNHCLAPEVKALEIQNSINSTTHQRYDLLKSKVSNVKSFDGLYSLLTDHDQYPKSICSHFESGAQDPSFTCGGGIIEIPRSSSSSHAKARFWRGCPHEGDDYEQIDAVSDGEKWSLQRVKSHL